MSNNLDDELKRIMLVRQHQVSEGITGCFALILILAALPFLIMGCAALIGCCGG